MYAVGYSGQLIQEGDIDRLALVTLDAVPGFALKDDLPLESVLEAP
jgi:hypothetical protein